LVRHTWRSVSFQLSSCGYLISLKSRAQVAQVSEKGAFWFLRLLFNFYFINLSPETCWRIVIEFIFLPFSKFIPEKVFSLAMAMLVILILFFISKSVPERLLFSPLTASV